MQYQISKSTNDHQYQVLVFEVVDMDIKIGLICYSDLNPLTVTLKASFSNDQKLVQAVKDKTNDY